MKIDNPTFEIIVSVGMCSDSVAINSNSLMKPAASKSKAILSHSLKNNISIKFKRFRRKNSVMSNITNVFSPKGCVSKISLNKNTIPINQKGT